MITYKDPVQEMLELQAEGYLIIAYLCIDSEYVYHCSKNTKAGLMVAIARLTKQQSELWEQVKNL